MAVRPEPKIGNKMVGKIIVGVALGIVVGVPMLTTALYLAAIAVAAGYGMQAGYAAVLLTLILINGFK